MKQELLKLGNVWCSNKQAGCEWTGELNQLEKHLNSKPERGNEALGCAFEDIQCRECAKILERRCLEDHPFNACPMKVVCCDNSAQGCQWMGRLGEMKRHLNSNPNLENRLTGCRYTLLKCPHNKCGRVFQRRNVVKHADVCSHRPVICKYCNSYVSTLDKVKLHWLVCGSFPMDCPKACGVKPRRQELNHHLAHECPRTEVDCEFSFVGCEARLPRSDMPYHLKDDIVTHLTLQAAHNRIESTQKVQLFYCFLLLVAVLGIIILLFGGFLYNHSKLHKEADAIFSSHRNALHILRQDIQGYADQLTDEYERKLNKLKQDLKARRSTSSDEVVPFDYWAEMKMDIDSCENNLDELKKALNVHHTAVHEALNSADLDHTFETCNFNVRTKPSWISQPFYRYGYRMRLHVFPNGIGECKGTHISLFLSLIHGEFDNQIEWPFRGNITVQLWNVKGEGRHHERTIDFNVDTPGKIEDTTARLWGHKDFISHKELKNDRLCYQVSILSKKTSDHELLLVLYTYLDSVYEFVVYLGGVAFIIAVILLYR